MLLTTGFVLLPCIVCIAACRHCVVHNPKEDALSILGFTVFVMTIIDIGILIAGFLYPNG